MHPITLISFWLSIAALALHLVPVSGIEAPNDRSAPHQRLVPKPEFLRAQSRFPRVRRAFARQQDRLKTAFQYRGALWPPRNLLLRAYKYEGELELYAAAQGPGARSLLVGVFPVCAPSGVLGPKRVEGDLQVPEGQYFIDRFNPVSRFHLSLGINYPNEVDRARSGDQNPGGDIFIHGGCATVGCLPVGDDAIEILYVAATLAKAYG